MAGGANQGLEVFFGPDGQQQDFTPGGDVNVEHTGIMFNLVEVPSVSVGEGGNTLHQQFPKLLNLFGRMIPYILDLDLAIKFQQHKPSLFLLKFCLTGIRFRPGKSFVFLLFFLGCSKSIRRNEG
jgi:hypothetical protein